MRGDPMGNQSLTTWSIDLEETRDGVFAVAQDVRIQSPPEAVNESEEVKDEDLTAGGEALVHL